LNVFLHTSLSTRHHTNTGATSLRHSGFGLLSSLGISSFVIPAGISSFVILFGNHLANTALLLSTAVKPARLQDILW
jgi:hypothetical protein